MSHFYKDSQDCWWFKTVGKGGMASSKHIRRLVQDCFDNTMQVLRSTGFSTEADSFESATVHWLSHTGISDDINLPSTKN